MDEHTGDEMPQLITPSDVEDAAASSSEDMQELAPDSEEDSELPSLEMTDESDGLAEEDVSPAHAAGTGVVTNNAQTYSSSAHSRGTGGGRSTGQHAAGINRNSRIWHVPDDVEPHEHSLGPAPTGNEDDSMHNFPLPSLQIMGPSGGGMILSVPVPSSLAAIIGLPGLSALMGQSSSRQPEPLFVPGGGMGRPVFRHPAAIAHSRSRNGHSQHAGSSGSSSTHRVTVMGTSSTFGSSNSTRISLPIPTAAVAAAVQHGASISAATPATRTNANLPLGNTTVTNNSDSMGVLGFLASGAAARQSAEVFAAAGAGQVPASLLTQQQHQQPQQQAAGVGQTSAAEREEDAPRYRPWSSTRGRYMVHATRTRARRTPTQDSTTAAVVPVSGEPFRFTAVPATHAAPPAQQGSTSAAVAGSSQATNSTAASQQQERRHQGLAASSSSSSSSSSMAWQHSRRFQLWPPWRLLASGVRLLHRLVFGAPCSTAASAIATASTTPAASSATTTQPSIHQAAVVPSAAASMFPASFRLAIPADAESSGAASPAAAATEAAMPAVTIQQPESSQPLSRRWQRRGATRGSRQQRRNQQQQQQIADDSDGIEFDTCDPIGADSGYESSGSDEMEPVAAAPATTAPAWQGSWPQVPESSVWMTSTGTPATPAAAITSSEAGASAAASSYHTNRPTQPVAKRGRRDAAGAGSSGASSSSAAPVLATPAAMGGSGAASSLVSPAAAGGSSAAPVLATPSAVAGSIAGPSTAAAAAPDTVRTPLRPNTFWPVTSARDASSWQELTPAVGLPERRTAAVATRLNVTAQPAAATAARASDAAGAAEEQQQPQSISEYGGESGDGSSNDSDSCPDLLDGSTSDDEVLMLAVEPRPASGSHLPLPPPSLCSDSGDSGLPSHVESHGPASGSSADGPPGLAGDSESNSETESDESEEPPELAPPRPQQRPIAASDSSTPSAYCSSTANPSANGLEPQLGSPPALIEDSESSRGGSDCDSDDSMPGLEIDQEGSTGSEPYSEQEDDYSSEEIHHSKDDNSSQDGSDGEQHSTAIDSDSDDSMPHLEADSDDDSTAAATGRAALAPAAGASSRGSSRQPGVGGVSRSRGSSSGPFRGSGLRAGFLGGRLERTTWTTELQQQQQPPNRTSRPTARRRSRRQRSPQMSDLAPPGLPAFLRSIAQEAAAFAAFGSGTDSEAYDEDSAISEGGWETASNESGRAAVSAGQPGSILEDPGATGSLLDVFMRDMRDHGHSSRRNSNDGNGAAASVAFGRPRSNAFVIPSTIGRELVQAAVPAQQVSSGADNVIPNRPAAPAPVKGLPSLQRPKATKPPAAAVAANTASSNSGAAQPAVQGVLLSVPAAEAAKKQTTKLIQDAAYTRQLLQGLLGVDVSDPGIASVLGMLKSGAYTLALTSTQSKDGKRLVPYEDYAYARNLERSKVMLRHWCTGTCYQ